MRLHFLRLHAGDTISGTGCLRDIRDCFFTSEASSKFISFSTVLVYYCVRDPQNVQVGVMPFTFLVCRSFTCSLSLMQCCR